MLDWDSFFFLPEASKSSSDWLQSWEIEQQLLRTLLPTFAEQTVKMLLRNIKFPLPLNASCDACQNALKMARKASFIDDKNLESYFVTYNHQNSLTAIVFCALKRKNIQDMLKIIYIIKEMSW